MTITKTVTYTCSDGKTFTDEKLAEKYETEITQKSEAKYEQWVRTSYGAKKLLAKHSLNEVGIWRILGEDPNCDFGGHHFQPELGAVEGKLEDAIRYAVKFPNFYTWGGGGDIQKVEIKRLTK
jgi:hypothetical protein